MNDTDAMLLQRYARQGDEAAFRVLVERYAGLVFRSALRYTGSAAMAEEAAQNTFALLAQRAAARPGSDHLAGWLHHTACHMARHLMRGERRRTARDSAAAALMDDSSSDHAQWDAMHEVLDETLQKLPGAEREALLLRYFRGLSLREVGESLHTSEDAARMKIARGLERLRSILARRGITSTTAALSGAFASCAAAATLPAELAARTAQAALTLPALPASILTTTATMTAKAKITFAAAGALLACTVAIPVGIAREHTLRGRIAEMQQKLDAQSAAAAEMLSSQTATAAVKPTLPSQPTAVSAAGAVDPAQIAAVQKAFDPKNPGRDLLLKAAGGLTKIPGMKKILAEQGRPIMESRYADLLDDHWQLGPEERGKAMDIICAAMAEQAASALEYLEGGITPEERTKLEAMKDQTDDARDKQLAALFNDPAKMEEFLRHEQSVGERQRLRTLKDQLTTDRTPLLSDAEETRLMDLMYAERQAAKAAAPLPDPENDVPAAADSATFPARREALDARILKEAATFLSPAQTTALAASLTATRESDAAQINLSNSIMGASPPPAEMP